MKAFGGFFLFAVMAFAAGFTWAGDGSLACDTSIACFDIATDGANITHIFVDSGCAASSITIDGEPVQELYTNGGPYQNISRDGWFPL